MHVSSNNANGTGSNQFSLLGLHTPPTATNPPSPVLGLQVFSRERLPLFATADPATGSNNAEFYLARVLPSPGRTRTLEVSFFDLGDSPATAVGGPSQGQLTITADNASFNGSSSAANCLYTAPPGFAPNSPQEPWGAFTASNACTFSYDAASWNGQWVTVRIPIPPDYTCNTSGSSTFDDCWIQLNVKPNGTNPLADASTWTAKMAGSPVRLVG